MRNIYLIRHGKVNYNHRCVGQTDLPLEWNAYEEFNGTGYSPFSAQEDMQWRFYCMMKDGTIQVDKYLEKKSYDCYLITTHIQEGGNTFGFVKKKYDDVVTIKLINLKIFPK